MIRRINIIRAPTIENTTSLSDFHYGIIFASRLQGCDASARKRKTRRYIIDKPPPEFQAAVFDSVGYKGNFQLFVLTFAVPQNVQQAHRAEGQGGEVEECDFGFLADGGEAIVEGVQIAAVPLGKAQFPGQNVVNFGHGSNRCAVNGDLFHQGSPYSSSKLS
jgi:hypothetical protein